MAEPTRLPLYEEAEQRLPTSNKDSLTTNAFYESSKKGQTYVVKRPGITSYITASGQAQGVYHHDGQTFSFAETPVYWSDSIWTGSKFAVIGNKPADFLVGYPDVVLFSSEGLTWNQGILPVAAEWSCIAHNGTAYVAAAPSRTSPSQAAQIATSTNGMVWTSRTSPDGDWTGAAEDGTNFVLVGTSGGTVYAAYSSDNGASWSNGNLGSSDWRAAAWNSSAGVFCAVSSNALTTVSTSPTGATWTNRAIASAPSGRFGIASNGTIFVTVGANTAVAHTSPDGVTWTQRTLPNSRNWKKVYWTGDKFIVLDGNATSTQYMAYSSNGTTWAEVQLPILNTESGGGYTAYSTLAGDGTKIIVFGDGEAPYVNNGDPPVSRRYAYSDDDGGTFSLKDNGFSAVFPSIT